MEIYNKQAYSSVFEDQMAKEIGSRGRFYVLIRSLLWSLKPPQQAYLIKSVMQQLQYV